MIRCRFFGERRGSALLIVLGFLSFMVVSAVSFAIYMRAERMPSSALRRAVATRHLVKAALAEAISRIDDAVRDDPFPGLCATNGNYSVADNARFYYFRNGGGGDQAIDVWDGRVFMPPDPLGGTYDAETRYAPITETASPLTLEGLGYVPPPLVNDVRFLSRSSWAASWQQFPFDAGRFCYCVVNVSDYLDVNRISANQPRSAEAGRRLSIAHLFDQNFDPLDAYANNNYQGSSVANPSGDAAKFDDFTGKKAGSPFTGYVPGDNVGGTYEKWSPVGSTSPYVSVLDYNLALAAGGPNSYLKPLYYEWLANKPKKQAYYIAQSSGKGTTDMAAALRQPFVADSWSTNENWIVDISTQDGQPFTASMIADKNGRVTYDEIQNAQTSFMRALDSSKLVGFVDYVMLYDYLDHNNVPVSLALPCVERVPMVVGLTPPQFKPTKFVPAGDDETKTWHFDAKAWFDDNQEMQAVIAFPFRHGKDREDRNYKAQAFVKLVYAPAGANKATLGATVRPTKTDWTTQGRRMENGLLSFSCLSKEMTFTVPDTVANQERASISGNGLLSFQFGDFTPNQLQPSVDVLKMDTVPVGEKAGDGTQEKKKKVYTVLVSPLDDKGAAAFPVGQTMEAGDFNTAAGSVFVPHVFVWVRIINSQGKTVDLVPAGFQDDEDVAGKSLSLQLSDECGALVGEATGPGKKPAFEFVSTVPQTELSLATIAAATGSFGSGDADWSPKAIYAVDPRFNAQPEHWYALNNANISFSDWLNKTQDALADDSMADRDQDIFMFNSNQGILQSVGEFGFLPYLHIADSDVASFGFNAVDREGAGPFGVSALEVMKRFGYLWRTYNPREFHARATEKGIGRNTQREQLVNPHTDNLSVMLAALANTPCDYWAAACGIDDANNKLFSQYGNKDFEGVTKFDDNYRRSYIFSRDNNDAKLQYADQIKIAKVIMTCMGGLSLQASDPVAKSVQAALGVNVSEAHNAVAKLLKNEIRNGTRPSQVWQLIWDKLWTTLAFDLDANDDNSFKEFLGIQMQEPLYTVDRKFLYSYWRDCFANKQQLFLVFVRAESSALGGPGEGTPAQLGGRAVALVWRDPDWTEGNGDNGRDRDFDSEYKEEENKMRPHRTRVLFYHQFD